MNKIVVFSGAGISAESGIPTFRDSNGLWEGHDPMVVANIMTWKSNFRKVHDFYNARRKALADVRPNVAHETVARWQRDYGAIVITQNIDDLFERAGCTDVVHVHGRLTELKCEACGYVWDIGYGEWTEDTACPNPARKCGCRKGLKPNVVFFGETAPNYRFMYKTFAELQAWDVVIVTGTSNQVIDIPALLFDRRGVKVYNALEEPTSDIWDYKYITPATVAFPSWIRC